MESAYAHHVDGLLLPRQLGGHPALELCNTRAGWGEAAPKEYLTSYDHLAALAAEAGVIAKGTARRLRGLAARDERAAERTLARTLAFRSALYEALAGHAGALGSVAREARAAAARCELVADDGGAAWRLVEDDRLELPLLGFAQAAASLLTSPQSADVASCPGHGCGWLFLSRGGRRRWCSMAVCGNRAKVRRHAQRARAQ